VSTPEEWGTAYARQAQVDIDAWDALQSNRDLPECQKLHFLQMACEKLAKAYLCKSGADPKSLQASHAYTAKNLPLIIRRQLDTARVRNPKTIREIVKNTRRLAREIELLAPAVDAGGKRPDNCEYPWENGNEKLHIPAEWTFSTIQLLAQPAGRTILKLIREAIVRLAQP
jgi:hypothetical protein